LEAHDDRSSRGGQLCFPVGDIGVVARRALAFGSGWSVMAVFNHSFYCQSREGRLLCVVQDSVARGPLTIRCTVPAAAHWSAWGVRRDAPVVFDGRALTIDRRLVLATARARPWQPQPLPRSLAVHALAAGLRSLAVEARGRIPREGLAPLVTRGMGTPCCLAAAPGVAALAAWLRNGLTDAGERTLAPPGRVAELVGLGPGLTPSGDDFLGGAMIALRTLGLERLAEALAGRILPLARKGSPTISFAHLRAAAEGLGAEPLHRTLSALAEPARWELGPQLDNIGRVGKTSGWDALAGAVLVLNALTEAGTDLEVRDRRRDLVDLRGGTS
jgi:hypothetical protein